MSPYTHAIVSIRGGRVFTGPLDACEKYMVDAGGEAYGWRLVTIEEAQQLARPVTISAGAILW
jgi:hypothetical protein